MHARAGARGGRLLICRLERAHPTSRPSSGRHRSIAFQARAGGKAALFLSPVWPEPSSSAAGVRTADLLEAFASWGFSVTFVSPAVPTAVGTEALAAAGAQALPCRINRQEDIAAAVAASAPSVVVFDRFYSEEAHGSRVRELAPGALRVLDMQDCHFLRGARQAAVAAGAGLAETLACTPDTSSPELLRELASIHRSDLTLVCSPVELALLRDVYGIPASKLALAPFFAPPSPHAAAAAAAAAAGGGGAEAAAAEAGFSGRRNFLMIGNWRHPPNLDSARWAAAEVWPRLRAALPAAERGAELHIYGAYPDGKAASLHRPAAGVHMLGFAPSLDVMLAYRLCLAPLRYGAGLKGKVVDSWWHGLPVVSTPIGAEGMLGGAADNGSPPAPGAWGGLCGGLSAEDVAADAAALYTDPALWAACQRSGFRLLGELYGREDNLGRVRAAVEGAAAGLAERRARDSTGAILWQQQYRSSDYFSRWIELKERQRELGGG